MSGKAEVLLEKILLVSTFQEVSTEEVDLEVLLPEVFHVKQANPSLQWTTFVHLFSWLRGLGKQGTQEEEELSFDKWDDPSTVADHILLSLKRIGLKIDISPMKLKHGYGEEVIQVLLYLVEMVLARHRFVFEPPEVPTEVNEPIEDLLDEQKHFSDHSSEQSIPEDLVAPVEMNSDSIVDEQMPGNVW